MCFLWPCGPVSLCQAEALDCILCKNSALHTGTILKVTPLEVGQRWKVCSLELFQCLTREDTSNSYIFIKSYLLDAPSKFPGLCGPEVCSLPSVYTCPLKPHVFYSELPEKMSVARIGFSSFYWPSCNAYLCFLTVSHLSISPDLPLKTPSPQSQRSSSVQ